MGDVEFDPVAYLAKKNPQPVPGQPTTPEQTPVNNQYGAFDPVAYLAKKNPPPAPERPWYSVSGAGLLQGAKNAASVVGKAGEALDSVTGAPIRKAVTELATGKKLDKAPSGSEQAGMMGVSDEPYKTQQAEPPKSLSDVGSGSIMSNALGGVNQLAGTKISPRDVVGLGLGAAQDPLLAAGEIGGALKLAGKAGASKLGLLKRFETLPKGNAEQIAQAAERLGVEPTAGMLSKNADIGNLESSLSQQPTVAGGKVMDTVNKVKEGLKSSAEGVMGDRTTLSSHEIGEDIKSAITAKIGEKLAPLKMSYDELAQTYQNVPLNTGKLKKYADGLRKSDIAEFPGTESGVIVHRYADMMEGAKSAASLRTLETEASRAMRAAQQAGNGNAVNAYSEVVGTLKNAQQSHIIRSAVDSMPATAAGASQGKNVANEVINQLKDTNKGYRALMEESQKIAKSAGVKAKSPGAFLDAIEDVKSEDLSKRMFNTKNYQGLQDIKEALPDQFELLRKAKLDEIANKSMTKGELDPVKLVNSIRGMEKEARGVVFGEAGDKMLKDMKTVIDSTPSMMGPSGTPRGNAWKALFSPQHYGQEMTDALQYMLLKAKGNNVKGLMSIAPEASQPSALMNAGKGLLKTSRTIKSAAPLAPQQKQGE